MKWLLFILIIICYPLCENITYSEFKKSYTVYMINKNNIIATICKDHHGNIWKMIHTSDKDWTVTDSLLLGTDKICTDLNK